MKIFQIAHADGESGSFNIIIPLTNEYTLGFHPGTNHVVTTKDQAEKHQNPTIAGEWTKETMQKGELVLFHTNLINTGGPACDTGSMRRDPLHVKEKHVEALGGFNYFSKINATNKITDMTFHYGRASKYFGMSTTHMYSSGIVSLMIFHPCKQKLAKRGQENYNTISKQTRKWRREGKTNYKQSCVELAKITRCVLSVYFRREDAQNA